MSCLTIFHKIYRSQEPHVGPCRAQMPFHYCINRFISCWCLVFNELGDSVRNQDTAQGHPQHNWAGQQAQSAVQYYHEDMIIRVLSTASLQGLQLTKDYNHGTIILLHKQASFPAGYKQKNKLHIPTIQATTSPKKNRANTWALPTSAQKQIWKLTKRLHLKRHN